MERIFVVGSYVTAKAEPNDFDCFLLLSVDVFQQNLRPFEYNLVSRAMARRMFRGDVVAAPADSVAAHDSLEFFQLTRLRKPRGIVEIV